jgi:hypothetical protein
MGASGGISWVNNPQLLIAGIIIAICIITGLVALIIFARVVKKNAMGAIKRRLHGKEILYQDSSAVYFGKKSLNKRQIRGNGILILCRDELIFRRIFPGMEMSIPLWQVKSIETTKRFLGKTFFKPLLKIDYQTETGKEDSVAWFVKDLDKLQKTLKALLKSN